MRPRLEEEKTRSGEADRGENERWWRRAAMNSNHAEYISPRLLRPDRLSGGWARWRAVNTLRVVCETGWCVNGGVWIASFVFYWIRYMEGRAEGWIFSLSQLISCKVRFCESAIEPLSGRRMFCQTMASRFFPRSVLAPSYRLTCLHLLFSHLDHRYERCEDFSEALISSFKNSSIKPILIRA